MEIIKAILLAISLLTVVGGLCMYILAMFAITTNIALTGKEREKNEKQISLLQKHGRNFIIIGLLVFCFATIYFYIFKL